MQNDHWNAVDAPPEPYEAVEVKFSDGSTTIGAWTGDEWKPVDGAWIIGWRRFQMMCSRRERGLG